jgi:hypothetical protein
MRNICRAMAFICSSIITCLIMNNAHPVAMGIVGFVLGFCASYGWTDD